MPATAPPNLLGLSPAQLRTFFTASGEKPFRAAQVSQWIHQRGIADFAQMTDLSKPLRTKLAATAEIRPPQIIATHRSQDGTRKWLLRVPGGSAIETVFIPEAGRGTLCVSSQAGCALDCSFCSTGKQGFHRNLSAAEIIGQLWLARKALADSGSRVTNVVLMGMGEPLLNFDNTVAAAQLMLDDHAYGLSKRRVTLSTAGVVPQIDRLADHLDLCLALSLHAPDDALRDQLVPPNRKYPIHDLLRSARNYLARLPDKGRKLTIEYTLMDAINDRPAQATQLAQLLRDTPCKINLIPFNPFPGSPYRPTPPHALQRFRNILHRSGYTVTVRTPRGTDIDAACGQLAGRIQDRTQRSRRYQMPPRPLNPARIPLATAEF